MDFARQLRLAGGRFWCGLVISAVALTSIRPAIAAREFPRLSRLDELPASRLRTELGRLPLPAQGRARQWLSSFHFSELDVSSMHTDASGGICFACQFSRAARTEPVEPAPPPIAAAAVPVGPFPSSLVFHSRPGAPNVLFVNFSGETVVDTEWNTLVGRSEIPAVAFSTDSDLSTFSDAEQTAIRSIWQRMAEDFAPFNIDVTTERPGTFNIRTAMALITRDTDANGDPNPYDTSGGVAYVNAFGTSQFAIHRPAWIYHNNLGNGESYVAEAASHEIGHNLGLSHDGRTDGSEYYNGHGSDDTSWAPLMGTGYNRNVSQWSQGEYYLASNTQDDLATIAAKISYRADDHGGTAASATALTITGGVNIVSTTPGNDPANTNPANKGVFEHGADRDVFSFITGAGPINLSVNPWIMPSGTRGGNLDILIELYNDAGVLLLTNNPASQTTARIQTSLGEGRYFLHVRNSGAGDPFSATPTGYTSYGSIGQYFISGSITEATGVIVPPLAELNVTDLTGPGQSGKPFTVTYSDNVAINVATIDSADIRITGPNGYDQLAQFVSLNPSGNGTPRTATYLAGPPGGGVWSTQDNGTYSVFMRSGQVADTEGAYVTAAQLGQFEVSVPELIYSANMDVNPGWTLEPQWQYGTPNDGSSGPSSGFTGTHVIGYNLNGNYANNLSVKYATTPQIDCSGSSSVTLRFKRWLRTRQNDPASIQVTADGANWVNVWSTSAAVSDTDWREMEYTLPAAAGGSSTVRLRWGLASNSFQTAIGWNIDDVELLGDGAFDTTPPVPALNVADLMTGGSPSHSCGVTYTDETAVLLPSLGSDDLRVTGPNGYSSPAGFVGANLPGDGSPMTGTYSIPAPGGTWDSADNGTYMVTLIGGAVEDTRNNAIPQTALGTFEVSISAPSPGQLAVTPAGELASSGTVGGPFVPSSINYTLNNSGGTALDWTAAKTQTWVSLSAAGGSLAPGTSAIVTVSINANADGLAADTYADTVSFANTTNGIGNTSRSVSLTVNSPGNLEATPAELVESSGHIGGPFVPVSHPYILTNSGGTALDWMASTPAPWLTLSPTTGTLAPFSSTVVTAMLDGDASLLPVGSYSVNVSFFNASGGNEPSLHDMQLDVYPLPTLIGSIQTFTSVFRASMTGVPGWTYYLEVSSDLHNWIRVDTRQADSEGVIEFTDLEAAALQRRLYRAVPAP